MLRPLMRSLILLLAASALARRLPGPQFGRRRREPEGAADAGIFVPLSAGDTGGDDSVFAAAAARVGGGERRPQARAPAESWLAEARRTVMLFFTPRMAMLAPLFWYTGFNRTPPRHHSPATRRRPARPRV